MNETNVTLGENIESSDVPNTTTIGYNAIISDDGSFRTGSGSSQQGESVAIGSESKVTHPLSVAIGHQSRSLHRDTQPGGGHRCGVAIGWRAMTKGHGCSAIGAGAEAIGNRSIAIGRQPTTGGTHPISIGYRSAATADETLAIGAHAEATAPGAIAIGAEAESHQANTLIISLDGNPALELEKDGTLKVAGDVIANAEITGRKNYWERFAAKIRKKTAAISSAILRRLQRLR